MLCTHLCGNPAESPLEALCGSLAESAAETLCGKFRGNFAESPAELCGKWKISEYAVAEASGNLTESCGKLGEGLSDGPCVSVRTQEDPKIENFQDFRLGLKFSSENETFNRE